MKESLKAAGLVSMVAACLGFSLSPCRGGEGQVALEVREFMQSPRHEVVTSGIPLLPGFLAAPESCVLTDASGAELPCEKTALARWPDGSVKWLLLDFPLQASAGATKKLMLEKGAPRRSPPKTPLAVDTASDAFTVRTGEITARINRKTFTFFDQVALQGGAPLVAGGGSSIEVEPIPPGAPAAENWLRDAAGGPRETYTARITGSSVEFRNTQRLTLLLEGVYSDPKGKRFGPFQVRYTFWNGSGKVGVEHFFAIDVESKTHFLRTARLRLKLPAPAPLKVTYGVDQNAFFPVPDDQAESSLSAVMPDRFYHNVPYDAPRAVAFQVVGKEREGDEKLLHTGVEASGVVALENAHGSVAVVLRDFSRLHPKEIVVDREQGILDYYLWAERGGKVLDLRRRYDDVREAGQYDRGNNAQGGRGVGKTHHLLFEFSATSSSPEHLTALAAHVTEPLMAFAAPAHYSDTGVFGPFSPVDNERFPRWEAMVRLQMEYLLRLPLQFHWDGMIDWGDLLLHDYQSVPHKQQSSPPEKGFIVRGYDGWLNNDTNAGREILLFFLRSMDDRLWSFWQRQVQHVMDVDTVHGSSSPKRIGSGRRHDQQHWGSSFCGYGTAAVEASDLYYLTGSQRSRSMALLYADWYLHDGGTEWPTKLAAIVRAYEITGNAKYKRYLDSAECRNDPQTLKLGSGVISALDRPTWRTSGTEVGVDLLRQLPEGRKWDRQFVEASRTLLTAPEATQRWGARTLAFGYLDSRDPEILAGLQQLLYGRGYRPADPDYFRAYPELQEDLSKLDFDTLQARSRQVLLPGPGARTIIYTYRVFPAIMQALKEAGLDEAVIFPPHP